MGKTTCIVRLTPAACEQIQDRMLEACRKIAADHGLVIESAGWRSLDSGIGFEPAFRVSIPAPDGTPFNLAKEMFRYLAEQYGLAASDLGRELPLETKDSGSPASIQSDRNIQGTVAIT